jgi:hypothetical protein
MTITYSSDTVPLQPAELGDPEFLAIGRIIRACASIEDLVTLAIAELLGVNETGVVVTLGQTPISKRLSIGNYLAGVRGVEKPALWNRCFASVEMKEVLSARNAVAHGILLGRSEDERWAFLTAKTEDPMQGSAIQQVVSFKTGDLEGYAVMAEQLTLFIENNFGLQARRLSRRERPLLPHRKSQPKPTPSAKPKRQRRPSSE